MIEMIAKFIDPLSLAVLRWLGWSLLLGTGLAGVAWCITRVSRRYLSSAMICLLWMVVLLKFVMPDGPGFAYSASSIIGSATGLLSATAPASPVRTSNPGEAYADDLMWFPVTIGGAISVPTVQPRQTNLGWPAIVGVAYLLSAFGIAVYRIRRYRTFRSKCLTFPCVDRDVQHLVHSSAQRIGVRAPRDIRVYEGKSSLVVGGFSSILVLSRATLRDDRELEAVIVHELAHLRRADFLVRYLQWAVGTLLFFWPVVAWVNRRIDLAREHACDEWALRHGRLTPAEYARCLLNAVGGGKAETGYAPAAMASHPKWVERRIDMILSTVVRRRAGYIGALAGGAMVGGWGVFALSGAVIEKDKKAPTPENQEVIVLQNADGAEAGQANTKVRVFQAREGNSFSFQHANGAEGIWTSTVDGAAPAREHMLAIAKATPSPAQLQALYARNPNADIDEDGNISTAEHDAYYTALAMRAPARVLAAFPNADHDGDGVLTAAEAARWVTGTNIHAPHAMFLADDGAAGVASTPMVFVAKIDQEGEAGNSFTWNSANGDGDEAAAFVSDGTAPHVITWQSAEDEGAATETIELLPESGAKNVFVRRVGSSDDELQEIRVKMIPDGAAAEELMEFQVKVAGAGMPGETAPAVVRFRARGTGADDIAVINEANGSWLGHSRSGPGAIATIWLDENIDDTLNAAEIAAYLAEVENAPRALFLELNPEADYDGDGILTDDEKHEFLEERMSELHNRLMGGVGQIPHSAYGFLKRLHGVTDDKAGQHVEVRVNGDGNHRMRTVVIENGQVRVNGEVVDVDNLPAGVQVKFEGKGGNN